MKEITEEYYQKWKNIYWRVMFVPAFVIAIFFILGIYTGIWGLFIIGLIYEMGLALELNMLNIKRRICILEKKLK